VAVVVLGDQEAAAAAEAVAAVEVSWLLTLHEPMHIYSWGLHCI
jgi:hypothetical protein